MSSPIREAAAVILLRRVAAGGFEVFLLRRAPKSPFMPTAHVFPGGTCEDGEDARTAAARELFEEAGVLFAKDLPDGAAPLPANVATLEIPTLGKLRAMIHAGAPATRTLQQGGIVWATDAFVPWAHWITPSYEGSRRFSARFFTVELPPGQVATADRHETTTELWITPAAALARIGELALPPPQIRTLWELAQLANVDDVLAAARVRAEEPHPIMPRVAALATGEQALLLPWDPDYTTLGDGDATPLTYTPTWATGPSRFVMEDRAWKHVAAPGSTPAA